MAAGFVMAAAASSSLFGGTAQALPIIDQCGATIDSNIATESKRSTVTSTSFVDLHTTNFGITLGDTSRCAVVLFTAETSCKGGSSSDLCYVQVLDNGVPMKPTGGQVLDSESATPSTHAFAWVSRGTFMGNHNFTVQLRVGSTGTKLVLDSWTVDVQLLGPGKL
jgi:hypothetical protein